MEQVVFRVGGMSCGACEERLGRALGKRQGVLSAKADHHQAEVTVVFDPTAVSSETLRLWIAELGYEALV